MRTSYSALDTYNQCPQKYKFQEINKIKAPKSKEAVFGTLVHSTLKFMFSRDPLFPTLDEVLAHFRERWPTLEELNKESIHDPLKRSWTESEERAYFTEGTRILKNFYKKNAPWNFHNIDLESRFEVTIENPKSGETHILAGIIDRIDKLPDGGYEIIDYKTSKRMPSQETLAENLQLSLYSLGLQKRWPHIKPENITLSLYFLKHGEKLSTKPTVKTTEHTKIQVIKTIDEILEKNREGKEFEPMPSALCNWCSFRPICPAWKHLYKNQKSKISAESGSASGGKNQNEIDEIIKEYFEIKKAEQQNETRLKELQEQIKEYMTQDGLTRVFGDEGTISKKIVQRYEYDWEKIKTILSPIGKWEEVLKADEVKLRRILKELPKETQMDIEESRKVSKEYIVLTASTKKKQSEGLLLT